MSRLAKTIATIAALAVVSIAIRWLAYPAPQPPPPADEATDDLGDLPPTNSRFTIPLTIPLQVVENALNDAIPTSFKDSKTYKVPWKWFRRIKIKFSASATRGRVTATGDRGALRFAGSVRGTAQAHIVGPNPKLPFRLRLFGEARPRFRPNWDLDPNYSLSTRLTQPGRIVLPIPFASDINVSKRIEDKIAEEAEDYQEEVQEALSKAVSSVAKSAWEALCLTLRVYSDPDLWLQIEPTSARTTQVRVDEENVVLQIGIDAQTLVSTERNSPVCPFPKRLNIEQNQQPDIVELRLPVESTYDHLTSMLAMETVGATFGSRWAVQIDSVALSPHGDRLLLSTGVRVGIRDNRRRQWQGTLYIIAKPHLNEDAQILTLTELELDIESRNVLVEELGELSEDWLKSAFSEKAVLAVDPLLQRVRRQVNAALRAISVADVDLVAQVDSLRLSDVEVGAERVRLIMIVKGSTTATVGSSAGHR